MSELSRGGPSSGLHLFTLCWRVGRLPCHSSRLEEVRRDHHLGKLISIFELFLWVMSTCKWGASWPGQSYTGWQCHGGRQSVWHRILFGCSFPLKLLVDLYILDSWWFQLAQVLTEESKCFLAFLASLVPNELLFVIGWRNPNWPLNSLRLASLFYTYHFRLAEGWWRSLYSICELIKLY